MRAELMGEMPERKGRLTGWIADLFSQKAWHLQDKNGRNKRLMFAETEAGAIRKSQLLKSVPAEELVVNRAPYADGLKNDIYRLRDAMRANGWNV